MFFSTHFMNDSRAVTNDVQNDHFVQVISDYYRLLFHYLIHRIIANNICMLFYTHFMNDSREVTNDVQNDHFAQVISDYYRLLLHYLIYRIIEA